MGTFALSRFALTIGAAAALLAACGGLQSSIDAPGAMPRNPWTGTHKNQMTPDAKGRDLLYVANWSLSAILVYPAKARNPGPVETITDEVNYPSATCVDRSGNLYVTNAPDEGPYFISVYAPGAATPFEVISKGINAPAACAIDANDNLWVTNFDSGNVTEYLKGTTKPHTVITKGLVTPNGIAIDGHGNLYVANGPAESIEDDVQVYLPGSSSPTRTITDGVTSPVGIAVDANNALYVTNIRENNVQEYRYGGSKPYRTITASLDGPAGVTLNGTGRLYVSNYNDAKVVEFVRGSLTPSKKEISKELQAPQGIAYFPHITPRVVNH